MSESMTVEQKMARSIETWRKCDPILMASQSQAALTFAFRDMKRDILVLADGLNAQMANSRFHEANHCAAEKEIEALQARVAELEAEKWNAQIAEAALASVEQERNQLLVSLGKPEEITSPPHEDYDCLKKQYLALRSLANGRCRLASYWSDQCQKMTRDLLLTKGGIIDAERNTNAMLTDQLLQAEQERDELLSRLPDGMKHCTIVFKECEKGHGWLTATNWVQHGCPTCERDELRRRVAELESQLEDARYEIIEAGERRS